MDLATFRATSKPVKIQATYRKLSAAEVTAWKKGRLVGNVATAGYLRMCVAGAEDIADGAYLIED